MVTITREAESGDQGLYRAKVDGHQALGRTAGEALDGLRGHLEADRGTTVVLVQRLGADEYFGAAQIERLRGLMARLHRARDGGPALAPAEEQELGALIEAEIEASAKRAAALADQLTR